MKYTLTSAAIAAALTLTGISAHASCADPRAPAQQGVSHQMAPLFRQGPVAGNDSDKVSAGDRIVGTWLVTYTGGLTGEAFIQWHSDGTEWENIDFPILGGTICMGDWKAIGDRQVRRSHVGWLYTNGNPSGYFTETVPMKWRTMVLRIPESTMPSFTILTATCSPKRGARR
jgi:uncharacterized membrane protein